MSKYSSVLDIFFILNFSSSIADIINEMLLIKVRMEYTHPSLNSLIIDGNETDSIEELAKALFQ